MKNYSESELVELYDVIKILWLLCGDDEHILLQMYYLNQRNKLQFYVLLVADNRMIDFINRNEDLLSIILLKGEDNEES